MSAPATCILCWHLNAKLAIGCHKLAITSENKQIPKTVHRIQVKDWEIPAIQLSFWLSTILGSKLKIFVSRHGSVSVASAEESNLYEKQPFTKNDGPVSHDLTIQARAQVDRDIKQQQFSILKQQFPPFFVVPLVLNNFYFPFSKPLKRIGRNWFPPLFSVGSVKMNKKNNKKKRIKDRQVRKSCCDAERIKCFLFFFFDGGAPPFKMVAVWKIKAGSVGAFSRKRTGTSN